MPGARLEIDGETTRRLDSVAQDLAREFSGISSETIRIQVERVSNQLIKTASFLDFVPLLTRRFVRDELDRLKRMA